jgi:phosphoesterase RecJ-like protein
MDTQIKDIVDGAQKILIIQADNPDADSLASALALEQILHKLGKDPYLYCGIDMPDYLKYLKGWDRVSRDIPSQFDASIIVDTSAVQLLERLEKSEYRNWVASKPVIVLDHHDGVECDIPYATVALNRSDLVSTGDVIFHLSKDFSWPLNLEAMEYITTSILADTLGLTSENTGPESYRTIAELVENGVSRPKLEELRRSLSKMPEKIFRFKAELIGRTEFHGDGKIALVIIRDDEIKEYSPHYNPNPLIQGDHLQTKGVYVSVSLKHYSSGRVTASIRAVHNAPVAAELAESFGSGGHKHAAGFKLEGVKDIASVKAKCIEKLTDLLDKLNVSEDETIQHSF